MQQIANGDLTTGVGHAPSGSLLHTLGGTADTLRRMMQEINDTLALSMARAAAIPYGQVLGNEEMENVINSLFQCSNANYTPDGKRVLHILQQNDIERLLG